MSDKHIKAIHFDIDEIKLKAAYPYQNENHGPKSYVNAYGMIKRELAKEGFVHRQYSGYISKEPISDYKVTRTIRRLANQLPWLKGCFQKLDAENVPEQFDLREYFDDAAEKELKRRSLNKSIQQTLKNTKKAVQNVVINIQKRISKGKGMHL